MKKLEIEMLVFLILIFIMATVSLINRQHDEKQKRDNDNALIETTLQIQQLKLMKIL